MNFQKKLLKIKPIRFLSSLKITVTCLFLFFLLTFWGTLYQVEFGLYEAQQKFFYSFFFPIVESIPFPGGRLVLWVLFVNLVFTVLAKFRFRRDTIGILIIHSGLFSFFISAFITFHVAKEANVTFFEGEGTNVALAYADWELAVWPIIEKENALREARKITAYDTQPLKKGTILDFKEFGLNVLVKEYYKNSEAYKEHRMAIEPHPLNQSGVKYLLPKLGEKEPEKNMPGILFHIIQANGEETPMLLFGGEGKPTPVDIGGEIFQFQLQRKRLELPLFIKLLDFRKEVHPGTKTARSFESTVEIETPGGTREVIIFMNNPLRYKDYTFYQASYGIDQMGREQSTLAVVKNSGRLLPYLASFLTFFGLAIHFILMLIQSIRNRKNA